MARPGRTAAEPAADASLTALVEAERRYEERLVEARRRAVAEDEALAVELRALDDRDARETAAAEAALGARIAMARDQALADLAAASGARVAAWEGIDEDALDELADQLIDQLLAALGLAEDAP